MKGHGVENVFTLSGGHISPILTASEKLGIRVIDTRHEVSAVFAADAVSRLTGKPGIAIVTAGPGITNTITALKNAQLAESPLILFGGCPATLLKGKGALQDIDQMSLVKSITKWQKTITKVRDIVPIVRDAFQIAQSDTPGPVFIECPLDVLYPYKIVGKEFQAKGSSFKAQLTNMYLDYYATNMFAGAFNKSWDCSPKDAKILLPDKNYVQHAANLLKNAKKPLILLGSQSVLPPISPDKLAQFINKLGIPCYLGGMARGLLGRNNPLQMRQSRRDALKEADVVILGGIVTDFRLSYGRVLSSHSKVIAVNRNHKSLYKNEGTFWSSSCSINCDVASFFALLVQEMETYPRFKVDQGWIDALRQRDNEKEAKTAQIAKKATDKHLNPINLLVNLESVIPDDSILIADGGDFVGSSSYIVKPRGPLRWLDPGAFGTLGCGGGFAIGAKAVRPNSDVIILYGDGSVGYSLVEYDTFVRHKLPVLSVVGNDACWSQIVREQVPILGSPVSCMLDYSSYEKAVEAFGGKGFLLDRSNGDKIGPILKQAIELTRKGTPVMVNALIGKTSFREGSLSV